MGELRVLIFDFDGVILESNNVKTEAFECVFAQYPVHLAAMMAFHNAHVSLSRYAKFDHLLDLMGRAGDTELRERLAKDFSRHTLQRMMEVPFVAGARELLSDMGGRLPIYLASVTPEADLNIILDRRGLKPWFRGIYGCPPWTKPAALRDILQRESCLPEEAVLVGDSAGDQRAAAETGVGFVGRDSGLLFDHPPPKRMFPDLAAVAAYLKKQIK